MAQPILDDEQNVISVLVASLDLEWINESIANFNLPSNRSLLILDEYGNILGGFWTEEKLIGHSLADTAIFKDIVNLGGEGSLESSELDGVDKLFIFTNLKGLPGDHNIYVLLGIPQKEINELSRTAYFNQLLAWLLGLCLLFLVVYMSIRFIMDHYFIGLLERHDNQDFSIVKKKKKK